MTPPAFVIIGAGPGGEAAAKRAARAGASVTLVNKGAWGGLCLNRGCVPSKTLLEGARLLHLARAEKSLAGAEGLKIRWDSLQKKKTQMVDSLRAAVVQNYSRLKVQILEGEAAFTRANAVSVNGTEVPFEKAVIAAGSEPFFPSPFESLRDQILDSDKALALGAVPQSILVVGGGAIGCEFACLFHELGARVTLVEKTEALLPGEDAGVVRVLQSSFEKRGIAVKTGCTVQFAEKHPTGWRCVLSNHETIETAEALVCVGRRPAFGALGLDKAQIKTEAGAVAVNSFFQTSQPHIYAVGDVNGLSLLAHAASAQAERAVDHALGKEVSSGRLLVPRCLYTWPEVASVGEWAYSAEAAHIAVKTARAFFQGNPKAMASNETEGFVQVVYDTASGHVLGAQIVGPHATELIHIFSTAIRAKFSMDDLRDVVFAHPTLSESIKEALSR